MISFDLRSNRRRLLVLGVGFFTAWKKQRSQRPLPPWLGLVPAAAPGRPLLLILALAPGPLLAVFAPALTVSATAPLLVTVLLLAPMTAVAALLPVLGFGAVPVLALPTHIGHEEVKIKVQF